MPKYVFKCKECDSVRTVFVNPNIDTVMCKDCDSKAIRQLPNTNKSSVKELIDPYSGVYLSPEYKEEMSQRSLDYFWAVEVPRLCGEYPQSECIANGWAYINEKGEFCIHTKPPNRR